jgi:hypothetical protein
MIKEFPQNHAELVELLQSGGLPRYVDEFTFRLNEGNVQVHTLDRLDSFVDGMANKRLTYAGLIQ